MANTLNRNTQDRIPLLFPHQEMGDKRSDLGRFLYWVDFSDGKLINYSSSAHRIEAIGTRPESLIQDVLHANKNNDTLPYSQINGVTAMGSSSGGANFLEMSTDVGPVSQMTLFLVVSQVNGSKTLVQFNNSGVHVKTDEVDIGGESSIAYNSTSLGLTIDDKLTHIFVLKWDAESGEVYVSVDGFLLELLSTNATDSHDNPSTLFVGGTTGTGFNGKIGEVMISGSCFNNTKINAVGRFLCDKWKTNWSDLLV